MYDKSLLFDIFEEIIDATQTVIERCSKVGCMDDFLDDEQGEILLDSICMLLIAIGESVKQIDKITDKKLLQQYPNIPWKSITGMRDILSHHYFDLNAEIIYNLCQEHIKDLNSTLKQIHNELKL
jgi:uncharacterized protein with HEPN domain